MSDQIKAAGANTTSQHRPVIKLSSRDLLHTGLLACIIGTVFFIYHFFGVTEIGYNATLTTDSVFEWLYERWKFDWNESKFAITHWVPLISLLLVWMDRKRISQLKTNVNWWGLGLVLLAILLHGAGTKTEQSRISTFSLIVLSWGIPLFVCGWPVARRLIFPCSFLVLCIPLGFLSGIATALQQISSALASGLLAGLGFDVTHAGPTLINNQLDGLLLNMGDGWSDFHVITAAVIFSMLCAYVARIFWWQRVVVVAIGLPLYFLAQITRAFLGVLSGTIVGTTPGIATFKAVSGPTVLLILFAGIGVCAWYFNRKNPRIHNHFASINTVPSPHKTGLALVVVLGALLMAAWWIPSARNIAHSEEAGVNIDAHVLLDGWKGSTVLYCYNPADLREVIADSLRGGDPCPHCGEPLQEMDPSEKLLLPPDTVVKKKRFVRESDKRPVYFSIVLSGKHRSSIHRPEVCLVGPDSQIAHSFIHYIPLQDGHRLKVKVLEMVMRYRNAEGQTVRRGSYYVYWFAGAGRETPSHLQRMIWMGADRLFKSQSSRWAYISMAGHRAFNQTDYLSEVDDFIRQVYPTLIINPPPH